MFIILDPLIVGLEGSYGFIYLSTETIITLPIRFCPFLINQENFVNHRFLTNQVPPVVQYWLWATSSTTEGVG